MEKYYIIIFSVLTFLSAAGAGWLAKQIGRSYKLWFFLSIPIPVIAICILICMPDKTKQRQRRPVAAGTVKSLLINEDSKTGKVYETNI